jgi:hypothetical protein
MTSGPLVLQLPLDDDFIYLLFRHAKTYILYLYFALF